MKKIILSFKRYSDGALLVLAQAIIVALTNNTYFPTISPSLAILTASVDSYSAALAAAAQGGKINIVVKNARKRDLINILVSLALDLMKLSDGDLIMLTSTAFPLSKDKTPVGPLDAPVILRLEDGPVSGSLRVVINGVKGAKIYGFEYTPDPLTETSQWDSEVDSGVKHTITDLEVGKRYWVRAVAYGKDGEESYSEPVSRIVQ